MSSSPPDRGATDAATAPCAEAAAGASSSTADSQPPKAASPKRYDTFKEYYDDVHLETEKKIMNQQLQTILRVKQPLCPDTEGVVRSFLDKTQDPVEITPTQAAALAALHAKKVAAIELRATLQKVRTAAATGARCHRITGNEIYSGCDTVYEPDDDESEEDDDHDGGNTRPGPLELEDGNHDRPRINGKGKKQKEPKVWPKSEIERINAQVHILIDELKDRGWTVQEHWSLEEDPAWCGPEDDAGTYEYLRVLLIKW